MAGETLQHVQKHWSSLKDKSAIYRFLLSDISLTHAEKGLVRARLTLAPNHINSKGGLHGSVQATLIDWIGGMAIASWDLRDNTGASVDIHITYIAPATEGETIEIEGRANKVGASMAFTTATIRKVGEDGEAGAFVATGTHTKFVKV